MHNSVKPLGPPPTRGSPRLRSLDPFPLPGRPPAQPSDEHWNAVLAQLDIALQPIVNIFTGACYGYEALLRGTEAAGFASIQDFFDISHTMGVLPDVEMVLRTRAAEKFVRLPHHAQSRLFINLDNRILDPCLDLPEQTRTMATRLGIADGALVFEVSERQPLPSGDASAADLFRRYKHNEFRVAIDDFGTGFSGLQLLYFTEPDFLKIDRFFVSDIATDARKRLFLSQIVNIAHLLGVVVLAEGVETEREYFVCKEIGCDLIQGYLVQHPTCDPAALKPHYETIEELARRERRTTTSDQRRIAEQIAVIAPVTVSASMEEVFQRLRADKTLTFIPVVDDRGEPLGILREKDLKDLTYSPFGKDLMHNKAYSRRLPHYVTRAPIADINTHAENILQAYTAVEISEGIIIVDGMRYVGFLSAQALLRIINEKNLAVARDQNPLSRLPGNAVIHEYVSEALAATDTEVVLAYFDFDNFKPFNDKYGFRLGDRAILLFAEILAKGVPRDRGFAGHVGGDDFFGGFRGMAFDAALARCRALIETFRSDVESFYDDESRRAGGIRGQDRLGNTMSFPLMTVSAVVIHLPAGRGVHTSDAISQLIADLKKEAKHAADRLCAASPMPGR
ncbi:MAG: GGDEF domain-containing protein [Magnetospirillum sp.]|nr:GGDEF domain-containing protein [Magnetospirillum sp.]